MKRTIALFLAVILTVMTVQVTAAAVVPGQAEVKASVSFRDQPSTSSGVMRYLKKGEKLALLDKVNAYWYQAQDVNGVVGYVSSGTQYITVHSEPHYSAPSVSVPGHGLAQVVASVSFRDLPSTSSNVMRYLKSGENIELLEKVNSYWYKVQEVNGVIGYVSSSDKYIHVIAEPQTSGPAPAPSPVPNTPTGEIIASVSFRTMPSTSAARMRFLQKGERVQIISQPNSYWYEVRDSGGVVGYVSTGDQYIRVSNWSNPVPGVGDAQLEAVIAVGMKYWGTPYQYGSNRSSTSTFDCSDFIRRIFIEGMNLTLPSNSRTQGDYVKTNGHTTTNLSQMKRGDLLFFSSYLGTSKSLYSGINKAKETITHVAIYLGDGQILHTYSKESGGVRIDNIGGNHWEYRLLFGGSVGK